MLIEDLHHASRRLRSRPAIAAAAVAMVALGVGITVAMFTILDALILRPVPFDDPDQLAFVHMRGAHGGPGGVSPAVLRAWRDADVFAGVEAALADVAILDVDGQLSTRSVARVTPGIFGLLGGVRPVVGRLFTESEGMPGADDRVLLSEELWRAAYGSDPGIVGRRIRVDREALVVVGILPSSFRFPSWNVEIWRAAAFGNRSPSKSNDSPMAYVRFVAQVPHADALRVATDAARRYDPANKERWAAAEPLAGMLLDAYSSRAVPLLAGGVFLVFLVLCANVGSLLLAGVNGRRYDISVCSALGASRLRLIREVLAESAAIAFAGTLAGIAVGVAFIATARVYLPDAFLMRSLHPLSLDLRALVVAATLTAIAVIVTGLMPAFTGTRVDLAAVLRSSNAATTSGPTSLRLARGFLVCEIAFACTLLVGATVLVRSFVNLTHTEPGVDVNRVATAWMSLPAAAFPDRAARTAVVRSIEEQVQQMPGIEAVAWSYGLPPSRGVISFGEWVSDGTAPVVVEADVDRYSVGPTFFEIYGIPLLRGRLFDPSDGPGDVILGERLARMLWAGGDPLGRTFGFGRERFRVIGVAREIRLPSVDAHVDRPEFYERFVGVGANAMMSVRCASSCPSSASIRQAIALASPAVHTIDVCLLSAVYAEQLARPRAAAALGFTFAAIAAIAAAGGLFSVLTYAAGRRRREFGIRAALGASARQIRWMVMRDATTIAVGGLAIGIVGAWMLGRVLMALEYDASPSDVQTWGIVLALLVATTIGAAWRPARDATRVDLVSSLREY